MTTPVLSHFDEGHAFQVIGKATRAWTPSQRRTLAGRIDPCRL